MNLQTRYDLEIEKDRLGAPRNTAAERGELSAGGEGCCCGTLTGCVILAALPGPVPE